MATVELKSITKVYPGKVTAVDSVDITVKDREFMVLVGPSGCGKTTTLRMVAGLEEITDGELSIDKRVVNDVPPKDRDIAMVFQNYALYPHMSVYDNMAFGLKIRRLPKAEIKQRVDEAARILGIEELLARKPKALSGGQRQRVAVGRAIVRKPKVFLFDEPLSNLDAKLRVQMRAEISTLHSKLDATMIYVTHDQVEAMTMGDRIVVMSDGLVQQIGDPLTLYDRPNNRFVAGFIGSPPMNFFHFNVMSKGSGVVLEHKNVTISPTSRDVRLLKDYVGQEIEMGIRPESLLPSDEAKSKVGAIDATVEMVEPLGAETHIYIIVEGRRLVARAHASTKIRMSDSIKVVPTMDKAIFFDAKTGKALHSSK